MSKHTPAPWTMIRHDAYDISYIIRGGKDQNQIAQIYNWQDISRDVSSKANARLIAAAPEMLEFIEWIVRLRIDDDVDGKARALIAKAGGYDATNE